MREPALVEAAFLSPGHCVICGGNEGHMIDTRVDVPGDGRIYFCVRTCLPIMGNAAGYCSPEQAQELLTRLAAASERINELEAEVVAERESKLMTVSDALALVDKTRLGDAGKIKEKAA